jgi:hypothetical protein
MIVIGDHRIGDRRWLVLIGLALFMVALFALAWYTGVWSQIGHYLPLVGHHAPLTSDPDFIHHH